MVPFGRELRAGFSSALLAGFDFFKYRYALIPLVLRQHLYLPAVNVNTGPITNKSWWNTWSKYLLLQVSGASSFSLIDRFLTDGCI